MYKFRCKISANLKIHTYISHTIYPCPKNLYPKQWGQWTGIFTFLLDNNRYPEFVSKSMFSRTGVHCCLCHVLRNICFVPLHVLLHKLPCILFHSIYRLNNAKRLPSQLYYICIIPRIRYGSCVKQDIYGLFPYHVCYFYLYIFQNRAWYGIQLNKTFTKWRDFPPTFNLFPVVHIPRSVFSKASTCKVKPMDYHSKSIFVFYACGFSRLLR